MLPRNRKIAAGALRFELEPDGGVRYLSWQNSEVISRIYFAVRDDHWGTAPAEIVDYSIFNDGNSFQVDFKIVHAAEGIEFVSTAKITGDSFGSLLYSVEGEALTTFDTNRIGFCVLHAASLAGSPCIVTHSDGQISRGYFPERISPHQPFLDIAAIESITPSTVGTTVTFTGEVFEMEDQRNWTDASFKTYCTPLSRPFPVKIHRGQKRYQAVSLKVSGTPKPAVSYADDTVKLYVEGKQVSRLPRIGIGMSPGRLSEPEADLLRALNLSHLRVDLDLNDPQFPDRFRLGADAAALVGTSIEAAIFIHSDDLLQQLDRLQKVVNDSQADICTWLVFNSDLDVTGKRSFEQVADKLRRLAPGSVVGGGTDNNFAELNRGWTRLPALDTIMFPVNPQVHAFDDASLFETLPIQGQLVSAATMFQPDTKIAVSPVTLQSRSDITNDPRLHRQLGAAWAVGCIKYLSEAKAWSVTMFDALGERGLINDRSTTTIYDAVQSIQQFAGADVFAVTSTCPAKAVGIYFDKAGKSRLLAINLTPYSVNFDIQSSANVDFSAFKSPIGGELKPYEVRTLDCSEGLNR